MDAMETTTPNGGGEGGEITIKKEAPEEETVAVKVETDAPKEADTISSVSYTHLRAHET